MFEGFQTDLIEVEDATVFVRHGGAGPAVLLLHGHPRTSATWQRVAPQLVAHGFTHHMAEEAPDALVASLRAFLDD